MDEINYLDKFSGTIIGVAIGDTMGRPFEGKLRDQIRRQYKTLNDLLNQKKRLFTTYTDDTQLTIHTANALIESSGFNIKTLIREYVKWLDDPPIGPGYGCLTAIKKLKYGIKWEKAASNSGGNGTAMRISPIGLFYCKDIEKLILSASISSKLTHAHPAASIASIVIARAIAYLVEKDPKNSISIDEFFNVITDPIKNSNELICKEFLDILKKVKETVGSSIEVGLIKLSQAGVKPPYFIEQFIGKAFVHPYALSTVACAIFVFLSKLNSFEDCMFELVTAGGDSDTVGAIGGSLAGAYFGISNIPSSLINIVKERKKILQISKKLYEKFETLYLIR